MDLKTLAIDLGASSGRVMLGTFDGSRIGLKEVHRFKNHPVNVRGSLYWDILNLLNEIKQGTLKASRIGGKKISSMGIDTWGVDFGLLDSQGNLLGNPYSYRDSRCDGIMEEAFKRASKEYIFSQTGIQFINFNTIYQLLWMKLKNPQVLESAKTLLMIPDLLNYFLTGVKSAEYSDATTTQLYNPISMGWAVELMEKLGLPVSIFPEIHNPGTVIGGLSKDICEELGIESIPVISVASHDTGSAVAAVPAGNENFAYISSGTWSLIGVEADKPIINKKTLELNFTNEGGVNNTIRFLKNVMGLWLIQECQVQWEKEGEYIGFDTMVNMARDARPFVSYIDPDAPSFVAPGDMPRRIREFCSRTGQVVPEGKGDIIICILQSLALKYRNVVECLEDILDKKIDVIHMVGGGIQNTLLCQFTANATGKRVMAGPVEATAIGNVIVQAMSLNEIGSLKEARQIVGNSFPIEVYEPCDISSWDEAYEKFKRFIK